MVTPVQVEDSSCGNLASHLRIALNILKSHPSPTTTTDRDALISLLLCVLVERGTIPLLLKSLLGPEIQNVPEFEFNKGLCDLVATNSLLILDFARSKKSVVKLQMTSPNSSLLFEVLITNFGPQKFNVISKNSELSSKTLGSIYDMKRYLVNTESNFELNYSALSHFSTTTKEVILSPILNAWFQNKGLFTRLPYLLGIPEPCFHRIVSCLSHNDRKNLRLTCRQIRQLSPQASHRWSQGPGPQGFLPHNALRNYHHHHSNLSPMDMDEVSLCKSMVIDFFTGQRIPDRKARFI